MGVLFCVRLMMEPKQHYLDESQRPPQPTRPIAGPSPRKAPLVLMSEGGELLNANLLLLLCC